MPKTSLRLSGLPALLLAAFLGPPLAVAQTPDECPSPQQIAAELVRGINAIRAEPRQCGAIHYAAAPKLIWNEVLLQVTQRHSADMARRDYFSHVTPEGLRPGQRAAAAGYPWTSQGENIGVGPVSVKEVLRMWQDSPMHCGAMMKQEFHDVALACAAGKDKLLWTLELGAQGWEP